MKVGRRQPEQRCYVLRADTNKQWLHSEQNDDKVLAVNTTMGSLENSSNTKSRAVLRLLGPMWPGVRRVETLAE